MSRKNLKFEIDFDFVLIALTTSLKDYRICYLINKSLNFNFVKVEDLELEIGANQSPVLFSNYLYSWENTETDFIFIANKGYEGYLVPEMREADYFMIIKNYIDESDLETIISSLNKIPEVVAAVKIDPKKVKSRENLLF
ncbi:IPExxxVDY family protein [Mucilaginibacter terrenus]|uniref:IPExxxVDY family protein n=1 Tax=Mucilaginibacter terrenus TaxID=2482727 RepID=A0A3E2NLQ9_9SPHI|nr:IPExxxVDY family protein [Mucilaginibacter terrenus]